MGYPRSDITFSGRFAIRSKDIVEYVIQNNPNKREEFLKLSVEFGGITSDGNKKTFASVESASQTLDRFLKGERVDIWAVEAFRLAAEWILMTQFEALKAELTSLKETLSNKPKEEKMETISMILGGFIEKAAFLN